MNDNKIKLRKKVFYAGLFLYCVPTVLQTTLLVEISYWNELFVYMRYIAFYFGFILIVDEHVRWNREKRFRLEFTDIRKSARCLLILAVTGISAVISGDRSFLACVILIMASENIELDQIIKAVFAMLTGTVLLTVGLCKIGFIQDLMFKRQAVPVRHALGFDYPSTVMSYLFFATVLYCWIRKMRLSLLEVILLEAVNAAFFRLTDARFGFIMTAVVVIGVYILGLIQNKHPKKDIFKNTILRVLSDYLCVFLTIFALVLCMVFRTGFGQFMNKVLTKRIEYMVAGFRNYGVHLLGKHIEWIGFGGADDTDSLLMSYNYVDNSYVKILINYGVLIFILALVILVIVSKTIRMQYSDGRIFLFFCVLLYCFIEPRLLDIYVNPFLFAAAPFIKGGFLKNLGPKGEFM